MLWLFQSTVFSRGVWGEGGTYECDGVVAVEVEVEQVHEWEKVSHVEGAGGGVDTGVGCYWGGGD